MDIKKIITILVLLMISSTSNSMEFLKRIGNLINPDVPTLEKEIEETLKDTTLDKESKYKKLAHLYGDLHVAYMRNSERADYNEKYAMAIAASQKSYEKATAKAKEKRQKIRALEKKIDQQLEPSTPRSRPWLISLIGDYNELLELCPENAMYLDHLQTLQRQKTKDEIKDQIKALEEGDNKEGLLIAYNNLLTTLTDKEIAPYLIIIERLRKEVAQEDKIRQADAELINKYDDLRISLQRLEDDTTLPEKVRKLHLADQYAERAQLAQQIPCYENLAKDDANKAQLLRQEVLELKQAEEEDARLEECLRKLRYQEIQRNIGLVANSKDLTDITRKIQLANLLSERAQLWQQTPDHEQNAQEDIKRVRTLRQEALGIATAQKDTEKTQQLLALLTSSSQ